jgi:hypothetical protein
VKKFQHSLRCHEPADLADALAAHRTPQAVIVAQQIEAEAQRQLEAKRAELGRTIDRVNACLRARDAADEYRDAMAAQRHATAQIPLLEQAAQAAAAAVARAREDAGRELVVRAEALRDELQAVANQLAPVLELLIECERRLDDEVRRVVPTFTGVRALDWPACVSDQAWAGNLSIRT